MRIALQNRGKLFDKSIVSIIQSLDLVGETVIQRGLVAIEAPHAIAALFFAIGGIEQGAVARSSADAPEIDGVVRIDAAQNLRVGEFATVRVTRADEHDLWATTVKP